MIATVFDDEYSGCHGEAMLLQGSEFVGEAHMIREGLPTGPITRPPRLVARTDYHEGGSDR